MKKIEILGTGCPKCKKLAEHAEAAAGSLGIEYELDKITDINEIIKYGVMMTPALVIDGEVKSVGKVISVDEIRKILEDGNTKPGGCC
ncbi:MAG: TM0996/MTH895 family glutaredoxin-like protein [Candidatus Krumholzibacteriota bacterium]|nr:TM0996/MTH895 family glutaredoxin-like protein [Candidatus Krumholzibacteriota bacterium]